MPKMTGQNRIREHAALIVSLSEALGEFVKACGVDLPDLQHRLAIIQELAYASIPKDEQRAFGLTYAATVGVTAPPEISTGDNGTLVHAEQTEGV